MEQKNQEAETLSINEFNKVLGFLNPPPKFKNTAMLLVNTYILANDKLKKQDALIEELEKDKPETAKLFNELRDTKAKLDNSMNETQSMTNLIVVLMAHFKKEELFISNGEIENIDMKKINAVDFCPDKKDGKDGITVKIEKVNG